MKRFLLFVIILSSALFTSAFTTGDTIVSLVNIYPGPDIYELEGHTLLRLQTTDSDIAVSYGTYDFNQPNFVYRFVKGETDYWASAAPWDALTAVYKAQGRRIVEHPIKLDRAQTDHLLDLVSINFLPENRTYRYNYVKDNCATRPLRIVERAIGDSIILGAVPQGLEGEQTFRSVMRHYHRNYPWYQFGIDLALGSGIDRPIDNREIAFAPAALDIQLLDATAAGQNLSDTVIVVNDVAPDAAVLAATPPQFTPMAAALLLLVITIVVTFSDLRRRKVSRWFDAILFTLFTLAGLVITFLVFISVHEATSPNILLLWLNPLCLIPVTLIWIKRCEIIVFSYQIVNFVALLVLAALWIAEVQAVNIAFIPLVLCDAIRSANYIYLNINNIKCRA